MKKILLLLGVVTLIGCGPSASDKKSGPKKKFWYKTY